ncbi:MAG: hypothetical protein A2X13_04510 [Bacteroidetes bacterium GWC2_33_15]|nr:MAG: hypothetical protein A2X10_06355 [Bacteroidetes bacterium GWA2_33_15]OFX49793.1 MAG: hypothetical protein A2X13_04510 [Bacteroidetes bacterium GWC2_33_15]OFX64984.1 MAG: hypothetical protein A2X15_06430 [Bacteroidetes bacterium GWB2_32_14]OFX69054.1 MAG: hypothetical protein A2X14_13725 [Bacteroidetes bacterium GWD2_33_33]HAN18324.1 hypothetical protein [Bacteroidales bacterium]
MKNFINLLIFIILFFNLFLVHSQTNNSDSIKNIPADKKIDFYIQSGILNKQTNFRIAENSFLLAKKTADSIKSYDKSIESLYHLGKLYYYHFEFTKALEVFNALIEKNSLLLSDQIRAESNHFLGLTYIRFNNYEKSLVYIQQALYYYESKGSKPEIALALKDIGNVYLSLGNQNSALDQYQKALVIFLELKDDEGIAMCYNNIGMIFSQKENFPLALDYLNKALELKKKNKNLQGYANTLGNIGNAFIKAGEYNKSLNYFFQALEIYKEFNNPSGLSEIYNCLGDAYLGQKDYNNAVKYLNNGKEIAEQNNLTNLIILNSELFSKVYLEKGNYKRAIEFYKQYSTLKDSVFESLTNQQIADYRTIYNNLKIENELILQERQILRQKYQFNFILVILITSLVFLILLILQNRQIRKKSRRIQSINRELDERVQKKTSELRISQFSVDLAIDAIIWMKKDGRFIYANNSACNLLGYSESEILELSVFDIVQEFSQDVWQEYWNKLKKNKSYVIQLYYKTKQGSEIPVEAAFNIREFEGEEYNFTFSRNITDRKIAEEKLKNAKEKAEKSDRLKSAFLANMSHEIRTPMNAITGFTNLLIDPELTYKEKQEITGLIKASSNDLLNLINDIIDISKIEADVLTINKSLHYVNEILTDMYKLFSQDISLKIKHLELILDLEQDSDRIAIYTDYARFRQILNNLLNNAIKFTEEGQISFGYRQISVGNRKLLRFFVKDTGIGITKENQVSIFDRFNRLNDERRKIYKGTGLGLAISKKLVSMLGGDIGVESDEGMGSEFYFSLPYQEMDKSVIPYSANILEKQSIDWSSKSILVVEDTPSNYILIENFLKSSKMKILWAKSGKEAIDIFKENPHIDLILMDIQLPGINGYEATKLIKAQNNSVPVIAQTAYALAGEKEYSISEGCDDYISKPIKQENLIEVLMKFLK